MGKASIIPASFGEGAFGQKVLENASCAVIWGEGPGHTSVG